MDLAHTKIGIVGLGYVGLPIALEFAKKYPVIGFDINKEKVEKLRQDTDPSTEIESSDLAASTVKFTYSKEDIADCNTYIIAVPTPVDENKVPDLQHLKSACQIVGTLLSKGDIAIFESTVYPGCTEEVCIPILEQISGLKYIEDFKVGYSPERINPGDKVRKITNVIKVVSATDEESLAYVSQIYTSIIDAGVYEAASIKVAEAAKIVENTQRNINIALMNELVMIFDKLDIDTNEVLAAASTKWNFHPYYPGLVGGHCIDVDPYYLTYKAELEGHNPEIILAGKRINSLIPGFIAKQVVKHLLKKEKILSKSNILIKGVTYKENVSDHRNSKVIDLSLIHI